MIISLFRIMGILLPARIALLLAIPFLCCCGEGGTDPLPSPPAYPGVGSGYRHRVTIVDSASGRTTLRVDTTRVVAAGLAFGGRENVVHLDSGHLYGYYIFQENGDVARLVYLYDPIALRAVDSAWQILPFGSRDTTRLAIDRVASGRQLALSIECSGLGTETLRVGGETFSTGVVRVVRIGSIGSPGGSADIVTVSIDTIHYAPTIFGFARWAGATRQASSADTLGFHDLSELEGYVVR